MNGITWVASYPKSGNTWLRVFLANLRAGSDRPVDINTLSSAQFSTRELLDRASGWKTSELRAEELAGLRLAAQRVLAGRADLPIKTHEAFAAADGAPRFAAEAVRAVLYVVRNPLDVAPSLSHHLNCGLDAAIAFLNNPAARISFPPGEPELDQPLGDWSSHVRGWTETPGIKRCVLRYEDLLTHPEREFARAAAVAGFSVSGDAVRRAAWHSRFEELKAQELAKGFGERLFDRSFFRAGRAGGWREVLSAEQVAAIIERHAAMMRRLGYLGEDGRPT